MTERGVQQNKTMKIALLDVVLVLIFALIPHASGNIQQGLLIALIAADMLLLANGRCKIEKQHKGVFIAFVLWLVWHLFIMLIYGSGVKRMIQFMAAFLTFWVAANYQITTKQLHRIRTIELILLGSWMVCFFLSRDVYTFKAYYVNSNSMGAMAFTAFMFFLLVPLKKKFWQCIVVLASLFIIWISGSRAVLLEVIVVFFAMIVIRNRSAKGWKLDLKLLFFAVAGAALFITIVYPSLFNTELGLKINDLSHRFFNKNFFSGRHTLWTLLLNLIGREPIIGYGLHAVPEAFIDVTVSSHNLYLQTALQAGWVSVVLLFLVLYKIYTVLIKKPNGLSYAMVGVLLGTIIYQCFEVSLTQNNWPIGLFVWVLLGIGVYQKKDESTYLSEDANDRKKDNETNI